MRLVPRWPEGEKKREGERQEERERERGRGRERGGEREGGRGDLAHTNYGVHCLKSTQNVLQTQKKLFISVSAQVGVVTAHLHETHTINSRTCVSM